MAANVARLVNQLAPGTLSPPSNCWITSKLHYKQTPCPPGSHVGAGDLDSGPHACMTGTLHTEPSLQLLE